MVEYKEVVASMATMANGNRAYNSDFRCTFSYPKVMLSQENALLHPNNNSWTTGDLAIASQSE